ncbi:MAG: hypothetical protein EOO39_03740 [Cytophagaceae bacterium]|nr:MAG: hypothetical protein EOO39_03740 [Cytophagaceae bacterium]
MKSHFTDQQIQQMLEAGLPLADINPVADANEVRLYQRVFDELKQPLPIQATPDFSNRVISQLGVHRPTPTDAGVYSWVLIGIVSCLLIGTLLLPPFDGETTDLLKGLLSIKPFKGILLFSLCSLVVFQFLDWKLVREPSLPTIL